MRKICAAGILLVGLSAGCGTKEIRPVDIYPEDNCANCRMAVSQKPFASEIIAGSGEVLKFDDLMCLEQYRRGNPELKIMAIFVTDYELGEWLTYEKSVVVRTAIQTPMGSGLVAVRDSARATELTNHYPVR